LSATPATLTVNINLPGTYAGVIQDGAGGGALSLTKSGIDTLALTGNNTYTGTLTIAAGALSVGSAANLGNPASMILQSNSMLRNTGPLTYASGINLQGSSTFNTDGGDLTLAGLIIGAASLTKTGPNFLTLTNNNSVRSGSTVINQGVLSISTDSNLSAASSGLTIANNALLLTTAPITMSRPITLSSGGQISPGGALTLNGNISGSGPLTVDFGSELVLGSVGNSYTGGTIVDGGTLGISADANLGNSSGSLTLINGGTLQALAPLTLVRPVVVNTGGGQLDTNGNNVTIAGTLSVNQSASLTKTGAGTLTIQSPSYAGQTAVLAGQVVVNGGTFTNAVSLFGGTLTLNSSNMNLGINALSANGGSTIEYRNTAVTGGYLMGSGIHTVPADSLSTSFTATQILSGADVRILAGTNFTTFERVINGGKLTVSSLIWRGGANTSSGNITINADLTEVFWSSDGVVTISPGASLTNSGGNLVLGGGSRTYLGSAASHGGAINLNGYTLELNGALLVNNGAIDGTVNVNYGSTAKGAGTYATVNVTDGGVYAPGNSPGIVTASAVTFSNTSTIAGPTLQIEIAGTTAGAQYDRLNVTGALSLGGTLAVSLVSGFAPAAGNSFDILDWGTLSGTFQTIGLPALTSGLMWNASQLYTTGTLRVNIAGDYNSNGIVDAADYVVWRKTIGQTGVGLAADGNVNNQIDQGDFDTWRAHLGQTAGSGASVTAIPEPPSIVLLIVTLAATAKRRFLPRHYEIPM
jgi:autotransporter-associated beta strand protein